MSSYPQPIAILPIFNSSEFNYSSSTLSISTADTRYLKLSGGVETGLVTFNGGVSTNTIYNGTGTFTVPNSGTDTFMTLGAIQTVSGAITFSSSSCTFQSQVGIKYSSFVGTFVPPILTSNQSYQLPNSSGFVVLDTASQTLTNKTLTSPSANTITITSAGSAGSPAIIFSETGNDTGFYHPSDGELDITCNSNRCVRLLNSEVDFYGPSGLRFEFLTGSGGGDIFRIQQNQGGGGQYFYVNSTVAYGVVSDQRIKTNISDMDDKKAVQLIKKLAPKKYKIKGNDKDECIGFLAQDVMKACGDEFKSIISDRGYKEDDETSPLLGINHSELFPIIISALKYILDKLDKASP